MPQPTSATLDQGLKSFIDAARSRGEHQIQCPTITAQFLLVHDRTAQQVVVFVPMQGYPSLGVYGSMSAQSVEDGAVHELDCLGRGYGEFRAGYGTYMYWTDPVTNTLWFKKIV
jgi:hypothetical protein